MTFIQLKYTHAAAVELDAAAAAEAAGVLVVVDAAGVAGAATAADVTYAEFALLDGGSSIGTTTSANKCQLFGRINV